MLKIGDEHEKAMADFQASKTFGIITFDEFFKGVELLRWWMMKHHSPAIDYSDLDFKAIDKEMMVDERARANKQDGVEGGNEGEGPVDAPVDPPTNLTIDPIV